jgi:tRNA-dihydrouridine synthase B
VHYGREPGIKIARKHVGWYSKGLTDSADFRVKINQTEDASAFHELIDSFYLPLYE